MTNEQILEEIQPYKPSEIIMCMNQARADELQEIEKRLQSLIPLPNNEFGQKLGTIMLVIATKLNSLREAK